MTTGDAIALAALVVAVIGAGFLFLWKEIVRLRDRFHHLEKLEKTLVNFMQFLRERDK